MSPLENIGHKPPGSNSVGVEWEGYGICPLRYHAIQVTLACHAFSNTAMCGMVQRFINQITLTLALLKC